MHASDSQFKLIALVIVLNIYHSGFPDGAWIKPILVINAFMVHSLVHPTLTTTPVHGVEIVHLYSSVSSSYGVAVQ